ncbi:MAG: 50S ribosomal protein L6 [Dehalococcoidia bacterium]|nr:50S ribosomal protein L6 [Dehalococcoidia bacterium]
MSRIGLLPITVPGGVQVNISEDNTVVVKGSLGELSRSFNRDMIIKMEDGHLRVSRPSDNRVHRSMHGLTRTLLSNMVVGVSNGFERVIEVKGVGYRVEKAASGLSFRVGYSQPVEFSVPAGVEAAVEGTNKVILKSRDKELVGEVAARIRRIRPCDHYKGKGIKYAEEKLRLKPGKAGKVTKG